MITGGEKMQKTGKQSFLGILLLSFLLLWTSSAFACLDLDDATYSIVGNSGPWFDGDNRLENVCEGDTVWVRVVVDDPGGCSGSGDNWEATRISFRYGSSGLFSQPVCDTSPSFSSGDHTLVFEVTIPDLPAGASPQALDVLVEIFNGNACSGVLFPGNNNNDDDDDDYNIFVQVQRITIIS